MDQALSQKLATDVLKTLDVAGSMEPLTTQYPGLSTSDGYEIAAAIRELRLIRGEKPLGWKIGFTNRTIWDEYNVHAPIWAPVWDTTYDPTDTNGVQACNLENLSEPRIEPEMMFRLARSPEPGMSIQELARCIDTVTLGFEVVQSIYPRWQFRAPDTIAAAGLHGRLHHGPLIEVAGLADFWPDLTESFSATLFCNGKIADKGEANSVLGGPLHALQAFVDGLSQTPLGPAIEPGSIVSTGTLTKALPIKSGQSWEISLNDFPLSAFILELT